MEFIKALENVKGKGPFLLLTERNVEAFRDLNECEERIAVLGLEPFAVLTLLWTGGPKEALDLKADDSRTQYRLPEKPQTVPSSEPIGMLRQPQPGWKREETKRPPVVLGDDRRSGRPHRFDRVGVPW